MSEQTPDASSTIADNHEPSMEDILASIRKIIADDDMESGAQLPSPGFADMTSDLVAEEADKDNTLDLDILEDSQDMDIPQIGTASPHTAATSSDESASDVELLLSDADEISDVPESALDVLDLDIALDEEPVAVDESVAADDTAFEDVLSVLEGDVDDVTETETPPIAPDTEDDLSLILDDMLADDGLSEETVEETVMDPAAELLEDVDELDEEITTTGDADIELVKSLMADLTDDPLYDEGLDEGEPDIPDINAAPTSEDENIMDEILSMTLDDETQLQEETAIADVIATEPVAVQTETVDNPLQAIAAEANADAASAETEGLKVMPEIVASAAISGVAATAAAVPKDDVEASLSMLDALMEDDESSETELEIPTTEPEQPIPEETPDMPKAAKDTIIDEVTETATADVFSSLNKVVEEKATVAERGDRIGDLVVEALRPMLKEWLDANLKGIVERAVTKEVKRISSGK